mmetsp:Transcript_13992/g.17628  ORF Transcript_13992/g.17628 Transcript_13992/m.17628 type:complete len:378 (-) Transcript_13992:186-1319(-)|eukprot:CAMPEP_0172503742 /NCGR_PEP_ID=MMETSP1066-20121228/171874_1 /TAXON_ID=671091 /ORGANISM="Coscinodiscus wailesii, Strain CCMP2513" /LENGTH=377 /DNA_ID=CAMNT_0013279597 /DNA_START=116 /DNA_END=1249 /DNA_ORIENTATION=-
MSAQTGPYGRHGFSQPGADGYGGGASPPGGGAPGSGGYGGAGYGGAGYGGASYAAPSPPMGAYSRSNANTSGVGGYGAGPTTGYGQADDEDKSKKGKKSLALQALNKNVIIWAGFFTTSMFIYYFLSGGDFSFLMTYGALSRMFGFGILNVKTFTSKRATGVSVKSLQLYSVVFFFRLTSIFRHEGYLPYDKSGDWLYHVIEFLALVFTTTALYGCMIPFKSTYQANLDRFGEMGVPPGLGAVYLAVPVLILATLIHPSLNSDWMSDVAWTYSMYLESVALIPQLFMFQKQESGVVELLTAHFVAALGFGRIMEFLFWIYSYHELATSSGSTMPGYVALFAQFIQLVLMLDFFWYYYIAVKNATPLVLPSNAGMGIV